MLYKDWYSWTVDGGDNPDYRGVLDKIKLDRTEGYEVRDFCNAFINSYDVPKTLHSFQKAERLIFHSSIKAEQMRKKIIEWFVQNWNSLD